MVFNVMLMNSRPKYREHRGRVFVVVTGKVQKMAGFVHHAEGLDVILQEREAYCSVVSWSLLNEVAILHTPELGTNLFF